MPYPTLVPNSTDLISPYGNRVRLMIQLDKPIIIIPSWQEAIYRAYVCEHYRVGFTFANCRGDYRNICWRKTCRATIDSTLGMIRCLHCGYYLCKRCGAHHPDCDGLLTMSEAAIERYARHNAGSILVPA